MNSKGIVLYRHAFNTPRLLITSLSGVKKVLGGGYNFERPQFAINLLQRTLGKGLLTVTVRFKMIHHKTISFFFFWVGCFVCVVLCGF